MSLVTPDFTGMPQEYIDGYPFKAGETYIYLGDISNMPGHCVVVGHMLRGRESEQGKILSGFHTDNFRELTEEEV